MANTQQGSVRDEPNKPTSLYFPVTRMPITRNRVWPHLNQRPPRLFFFLFPLFPSTAPPASFPPPPGWVTELDASVTVTAADESAVSLGAAAVVESLESLPTAALPFPPALKKSICRRSTVNESS